MMKTATEVSLETLIVSALNVGAVYAAAFTYKLNWTGVMTVMVVAALFTAGLTHMVLNKILMLKGRAEMMVNEGLGVMGIALISSLAILVILVQRFNLPEALGISLLSGMLTAFVRHLMNL